MVNGTRAVSISGQSGRRSSRPRPYNGNLDSYVRQVFAGLDPAGLGADPGRQSIQRTTINGLPAAYGAARVNTGSGRST